jgi:glucose-6-phosphate isomerase
MIPGWKGEIPTPQVRDVEDVRQVLAIPECPCSGPLYYMYRDLARSEEDRIWLHSHLLRYDITRIPPKTICGEYVKTKGHYHPDAPSQVSYPEVYEILGGEAHYLLQDRAVHDVVLIRAEEGAKVLVPPGYGHVTINASRKTLIMANLVSDAFSSEYGPYEERHGAAYYMMLGHHMMENPHYSHPPALREGTTLQSNALGIVEGVSLYELVEERKDLSFLYHPERFECVFRELAEG